MQRYQFISAENVIAKFLRDFRGLDVHEGDAIEWIAEALGFMKMVQASEEAVAFVEVKDYQIDLPRGLHYIIQIVRDNHWSPQTKEECTLKDLVELVESEGPCEKGWLKTAVPIDCDGKIIGDYEVAYYRPFFDLQYPFVNWADILKKYSRYTPVRLANHSFFNSLVCSVESPGLYNSTDLEYTIVQDKLRFSFKEGFVAVAYTRQMIDKETGYPMIPDDEDARAAISYYLAWKVKQREAYLQREGAAPLSKDAEAHWKRYRLQFVSKTKMPFGADQHQNLSEGNTYLLPNRNRYYGYFGRIGKAEKRTFSDPNGRQANFNIFRGV